MQPEQQYDTAPEVVTTDFPEQTLYESADAGVSAPPEAMSWQASEYVHHDKAGLWFLGLIGIATVLLLVDFFLIRSLTFGVLIVVMTVVVMVIARRSPGIVSYSLTAQGLQVDEKHFSFHDFRAFGVLQEGAMYSIRLIPQKRFMPAVNVFFPPEYGEQIVDVFGSVLPMEQLEPDLIDRIAERIRF